ncbi:CrcB family protein [Microbacterium oryzae]|uniref:fluoride efflux transporter FluC n=1 Tax=Microbacterium oryzae TaxID=743009 RepID=UPI0025B0AA39|nr:CrcB family protein [Microbacterium oryzae]MDN3311442.1 CrcB family protein [Microbacterium oryzae]
MRPAIPWGLLPLVCVGGAVGVTARHLLTLLAGEGAMVPVIALINVTGSLLLGVVAGACGARHARWRAFLGTGMLGGFTTYSAFAVQVAEALRGPQPLAAVAAALALLAVAVVAAAVGLAIGLRIAGRETRR